jgi:hypothetical protein
MLKLFFSKKFDFIGNLIAEISELVFVSQKLSDRLFHSRSQRGSPSNASFSWKNDLDRHSKPDKKSENVNDMVGLYVKCSRIKAQK